MAKAKDTIKMETIERGLKAIAHERVMPPSGFRRAIIESLAQQTSQAMPAESLAQRLRRWFSTGALVPAASAVAALALFALLSPTTQTDRPLVTSGQMAKVPQVSQGSTTSDGRQQSSVGGSEDNKSSVNSAGNIVALAAPVKNSEKNTPEKNINIVTAPVAAQKNKIEFTAERGLAVMPSRQPRSLRPIQRSQDPASKFTLVQVKQVSPAPALAGRAGGVEITPRPTPVAPVDGFSEVRRNVFKPGLGEFVAIMVKLDSTEHVEIGVYDLNGRKIADLLDETLNPGVHEIRWSGYNHGGEMSATGRYLVVVKTVEHLDRHKIALIR